jgi:hypothetical protein
MLAFRLKRTLADLRSSCRGSSGVTVREGGGVAQHHLAPDFSILYVESEDDGGIDRLARYVDSGAVASDRDDGITLRHELIDAEVHVALTAEECVEEGLDPRASPLRAGIGNDAPPIRAVYFITIGPS